MSSALGFRVAVGRHVPFIDSEEPCEPSWDVRFTFYADALVPRWMLTSVNVRPLVDK